MMRIFSSILMAGAVSLGAVSGASALTNDICNAPGKQPVGKLTATEGSVLIQRGDGFERAVTGTELKAGDKITVIGDGNAEFAYITGKQLAVARSSTETVCATESATGSLAYVEPLTSVSSTLGSSTSRPPFEVPQDNAPLMIFGMIGAGAGLGGVISTTQGNSRTIIFPVSP